MTDYFAADWGQSPFAWKLDEGELTSPQTLDQIGVRSRLKIEDINITDRFCNYFLAELSSDSFRLLTQRPLGTLDVKHLIIGCDGSDKASGSEFTLKSLSIRAAKLTKGK